MSENKNRRRRPKPNYLQRQNAVCITVHSQDGSKVPRSVLDEAADAVLTVAREHKLLINLAEV